MDETRAEDIVDGVKTAPVDSKGRVAVDALSDRSLLEEIATNLRTIVDTVDELSQSPMLASLRSGSNPLMAMFGR
jgi:hypothetical protein